MNFVFITGMGRSGTEFVSTLFHDIEGIKAFHEYIGDREFALLSWYLAGEYYTIPYLKRIKSIKITTFSNITKIILFCFRRNWRFPQFMLANTEPRRSHEKETKKVQSGTKSSHFKKTPVGQGAA